MRAHGNMEILLAPHGAEESFSGTASCATSDGALGSGRIQKMIIVISLTLRITRKILGLTFLGQKILPPSLV